MKAKMILHEYPSINSTMINPDEEDIKTYMSKLVRGTGDTIELAWDNNHMFLVTSTNRWLVKYSGVHVDDFVNAILTDPSQSSDAEIVFNDGGQRTGYILRETVAIETALQVAAYFTANGKLRNTATVRWNFIDRLSLSD